MVTNAGAEIEIEITVPTDFTFHYGTIIGVAFAGGWCRALDFTVEAYYNGSWVLLETVTNFPRETYSTKFTTGSYDLEKVRYTFTKYAFDNYATGFRISSLFALNYNSKRIAHMALPLDGGTVYGNVIISNDGSLTIGETELTEQNIIDLLALL